MICRKCEKECPDGSQFCPNCGAQLLEKSATPPANKKPESANKKPLAVPILVGIIALLLVLLVLFLMKKPSQIAQTRVATPPSSVAQGANTPVGPSQIAAGPNTPAKEVPQDVVDYLAKLQKIEEMRKQVTHDFGPALLELQNLNGSNFDVDQYEQAIKSAPQVNHPYIQKLQILASGVSNLQTPKSCMPLANSYLTVLQSHIAMIGEIRNITQTMDFSKIDAMQSFNTKYLNSLNDADNELKKVCDGTGAKKNFSISDSE